MSDSQDASLCLVGAMDDLWFNHPILFAEPSSALCLKSHPPSSDSTPPRSLDFLLSNPEEMLPVSAPQHQVDAETAENEENHDEDGARPTRISQATGKVRSKSHSPKTERQSKIGVGGLNLSSGKKLEKFNSSKTYEDLEQEEVKGFIDLGFRFNREHISPEMISVVPGLQRIIKSPTSYKKSPPQHVKPPKLVTKPEIEYFDSNEGGATARPYLSEAWLIKRPDSPLLSMRMRRGYAAADMKKQLKFWARTVASETRQES